MVQISSARPSLQLYRHATFLLIRLKPCVASSPDSTLPTNYTHICCTRHCASFAAWPRPTADFSTSCHCWLTHKCIHRAVTDAAFITYICASFLLIQVCHDPKDRPEISNRLCTHPPLAPATKNTMLFNFRATVTGSHLSGFRVRTHYLGRAHLWSSLPRFALALHTRRRHAPLLPGYSWARPPSSLLEECDPRCR